MRIRIAVPLGLVLLAGVTAGGLAGAAAAVRHGLAMHGDLRYSADFTHFDYVNPDAPRGGEIRRAEIGTFDSFNPFIIKGNPATGVGLLYDTLMVHAADEPFSLYGLLAESVETPADRSWVAFTLRPEARWHDGRPVSPEDVIWTFRTLLEQGSPAYRFYYGSVAGVEKTGPRTVKFTFAPGENRELPLILGELTVLPKHYWAGREFDKTTLEPPLGSGPYRIGRFEPGRVVTYERVADYWGKDLPVNVGRNHFDVVRFDYYRDETVAIEAFKGGEFDLRVENNSKQWATAYDIPQVADGSIRKQLFPHERTAGMQGFVFNLRRERFRDPRVRWALAHAFDFEWSNRVLFYGQYTRARSYFDNSELAATGLPSPEERTLLEPYRGRIPDEVFTTAYRPPATDGSGDIRGNLRKAVELLKEAGWEIRDGVMTNAETGETLAFEILLVQPAFERIALPFVKNLKRIGVEARVRTVDTSQYRRRMDSFDFDMTVGSWGQSRSPGNEQRDFWSSAAADREGSRNWIGIRSPAVDALVERLIAAPDRESLVARTRALDRVLQWGHYVIPHWYIGSDRIVYWNKFGRPEITPDQGVQLDTWWLAPQEPAPVEPGADETAPRNAGREAPSLGVVLLGVGILAVVGTWLVMRRRR
ncbi:MAG: extracellular solute-binding protein [Myxococcales bacterium]|nr:extracellular solute-binding protein [Myxococcales bacterium]